MDAQNRDGPQLDADPPARAPVVVRSPLAREEYVEQAYFFQMFRERLLDGQPSQEILIRIGEELLATTKLPIAISFLVSDLKLTGSLAPAMRRVRHYFTLFQAHIIGEAERDQSRFSFDQALVLLEREARYKAEQPTASGLFIFQFEAVCRNRLGYRDGLAAMADDPSYNDDWSDYILQLRAKLGDVDFADLVYARSEQYVADMTRRHGEFESRRPILFGAKEGRIAKANGGRDPLFLFAALQRQLGYPEVPRPRRYSDAESRLSELEKRVAYLEGRLKMAEMSGASSAAKPTEDDFPLEELIVKPENTAGVPSGWSAKPASGKPDPAG